MFLHKDEESYLARFDKVRGFAYDLTETLYCVTASALALPLKKHKHYTGTNRSNVLGPICCPPLSDSTSHNLVEWKEKKTVYSAMAKAQSRVGGVAPEGAPVEAATGRKPETVEPVNFHGYTASVWDELIHSHSVSAVVDFTPGGGYLAEACIVAKVPYVGFVQTDAHERVIRRYLFKRVWDLMCTPGSQHYESKHRAFMEETIVVDDDDDAATSAAADGGGRGRRGGRGRTGRGGSGGGAPASSGGGAPAAARGSGGGAPASSGGGAPAAASGATPQPCSELVKALRALETGQAPKKRTAKAAEGRSKKQKTKEKEEESEDSNSDAEA